MLTLRHFACHFGHPTNAALGWAQRPSVMKPKTAINSISRWRLWCLYLRSRVIQLRAESKYTHIISLLLREAADKTEFASDLQPHVCIYTEEPQVLPQLITLGNWIFPFRVVSHTFSLSLSLARTLQIERQRQTVGTGLISASKIIRRQNNSASFLALI